ncbi:MAG: endonuclease/exonuclease/phosphatase family protein [Tepidisphaeraceae bacterium]
MNAVDTRPQRLPGTRRKTLNIKRFKAGVLLFLFLGVLYWGCGRWSTGSASGPALAAPPTTRPASAKLRLATFNIHSGVGGKDDKFDLNRTAETLRGADVITLQEVAGGGLFSPDQAQLLGGIMGMTALFQPTETHFWMPAFGNAVLTNRPLGPWSRTALPNGYRMAHRSMVQFTVPIGDKTLTVLAVHLGKKSDRQRQFELVTKTFKALPEPAVLMGDLNTRPYENMMIGFLKTSGATDALGQYLAPGDRVDYIITRGLKCTNAGLIDIGASDHPSAFAEIEAE